MPKSQKIILSASRDTPFNNRVLNVRETVWRLAHSAKEKTPAFSAAGKSIHPFWGTAQPPLAAPQPSFTHANVLWKRRELKCGNTGRQVGP